MNTNEYIYVGSILQIEPQVLHCPVRSEQATVLKYDKRFGSIVDD